MERDVRGLSAFGKHVVEALESHRPERDAAIEKARVGFMREALQPAAERRKSWALGVAGAVVAAAAAVALIVTWPARSLRFSAGEEPGVAESWVAPSKGKTVPLRFSDGSLVRVEPESRARVVSLDANGASVVLETGRLHVDVVHSAKSAWRIIAGPLTVHVRGTRFDVAWSAATEEFSVTVSEGVISVSGSVAGADRPVRAGETLRVLVKERDLRLTNFDDGKLAQGAEAAAAAPTLGAEPPTTVEQAENERSAVAPAGTPGPLPSTTGPRGDDWRIHAASGRLRAAFLAAEAAGFETQCRGASAAELLQLGDGARLAGRADRARFALTTLRQSHAGDARRAAAAFALGKVAFDLERSYGEAAQWFATSVREQPGGSLSREASGRLIEAFDRAGDRAGAHAAAESYLARYPDGPHADLAHEILR